MQICVGAFCTQFCVSLEGLSCPYNIFPSYNIFLSLDPPMTLFTTQIWSIRSLGVDFYAPGGDLHTHWCRFIYTPGVDLHTHQCGFTHPVGFYTLGVSTSTSTTTSNSTSTSTSNSNSTSTSTLSQRNSKLRKLQVRETPSRRNSKSQENSKSVENSKSQKLQVGDTPSRAPKCIHPQIGSTSKLRPL